MAQLWAHKGHGTECGSECGTALDTQHSTENGSEPGTGQEQLCHTPWGRWIAALPKAGTAPPGKGVPCHLGIVLLAFPAAPVAGEVPALAVPRAALSTQPGWAPAETERILGWLCQEQIPAERWGQHSNNHRYPPRNEITSHPSLLGSASPRNPLWRCQPRSAQLREGVIPYKAGPGGSKGADTY